jgi:hypothetical protein
MSAIRLARGVTAENALSSSKGVTTGTETVCW